MQKQGHKLGEKEDKVHPIAEDLLNIQTNFDHEDGNDQHMKISSTIM